jgi:hypothetical protein
MTEPTTAAPAMQAPPEAQLMQLTSGCLVSPAIYIVTKLGIADLLKDGPKTAAELAEVTETNADALYRVMRATASIGVLEESGEKVFGNTPMSETLRVDWPKSTRAMTLWMLEPVHWRVYGDLMYSVKTGKTAWDNVYGEPCFDSLFGPMRELGDVFNQAMTSYSLQTIPPILAAYDFSQCGTIADIAGGYGHLLGAVLRQYPEARGVLFDLEPVLEGAPAMLDSYGVRDRVEIVAGDFTAAIPVRADAYLVKHIIHDWYDDKCQTILSNIRDAMPDDAKVLIIDAVVPPPGEPHFSKFLDLEMLMLPGGKERTAEEFGALLAASGFTLERVIPTQSSVSIIEATKL